MLQRIKDNWKSGVTVALISIPLSVSLAIASGASPVMGIITAVWAGLFAAIFGGSNLNVVGPAGALSAILATYAIQHGATALSGLAVVSGVFILIAYLGRLERYLIFVPASTIYGFTIGIAFIIFAGQINFLLGLQNIPKHERLMQNIWESLTHIPHASLSTFIVFLIFTVLLFFLSKKFPKFPGAISLAPLGILLGYAASAEWVPFSLLTLKDMYPTMTGAVFGPIDVKIHSDLLLTGVAVAFVSILETLLSAKIADGMSGTKHNSRKETLGLALANLASGFAGGMPATGVLARTALNVKTGATHKTSAGINSIAVAVISLLLFSYLKFLPLAVVAAILVFISIRMVETSHMKRMYRYDRRSFYIALVVALVTVYQDPIFGILLGATVSLILFMEKLSKGQFELIINDHSKRPSKHIMGEDIGNLEGPIDTLVYSIKGQLAYINAQAHVTRFESSLNGYNNVVLRLRELYFIDLDGVDAFSEIVGLISAQNKNVLVTGVNPLIASMLQESKEYKRLEDSGVVFTSTSEALRSLGYVLDANYRRSAHTRS